MTFEAFDVVAVPFPFTDRGRTKRRPALILSSGDFNQPAGHSILAMITSAKNQPWPADIPIEDLKSAGLPASSVIRMKLFTLDHRLVEKKLGTLAKGDRKNLAKVLQHVLRGIFKG